MSIGKKGKRVFEDVSTERIPAPPVGDVNRESRRMQITWWLAAQGALVVLTIVIGGLTRLTDSGLSITTWEPVRGILPPLSPDAWAKAFDQYKAIPEFSLQNSSMDLDAFKVIYWWEWIHRLVARLVGLVWLAGFLWFLWRRQLSRRQVLRFAAIGGLVLLQGLVGWWMVTSGLSGHMVDVAAYRLAVHSGLAFLILGVVVWSYWLSRKTAADLLQARRGRDARSFRMTTAILVLLSVQIVFGALVAGIDAGRGYTDWPLMNGEFLPSESFDYTPIWKNALENPALVQFNHRIAGYLILILAFVFWFRSRRSAMAKVRFAATVTFLVIVGQSCLGILTLVHGANWTAASLHQIGAILVLIFVLWARFLSGYPSGVLERKSQ